MLPEPATRLSRDEVESILAALERGTVVLTTDGQQLLLDFFAENPNETELSARFETILASEG